MENIKELIFNYYTIPTIFCLLYFWLLFYVDEKKLFKQNTYFSKDDKEIVVFFSLMPIVNCVLGGLSIVITFTFFCKKFIKLFE